MASTWIDTDEHELTTENLQLLLDNKIACIRIRNFATVDECESFTRAVNRRDMKLFSIEKKVGYIGIPQYEYRWDRPKSDYIRDSAAAYREIDQVFDNSFNALERFIGIIQGIWEKPVGPAQEKGIEGVEGDGTYYAGIVRSTSEGIDLHVDWAPVNSPTYDIANIDGQLGWNFFAEELVSGGQTTVHNAPWDPVVKPGIIPKSYGLDRQLVEGATTVTYKPTRGDVVLFNSRNPHEIKGGETEPGRSRVSIGSFVGRMPDKRLVLWS